MSRARRNRRSKGKLKQQKSVGGFPFFISLFALLFLGIYFITVLPSLQDSYAYSNWFRFLAGFVLGCWGASVFIKGHISVFLHELKHSIISNLVGNRSRGMKIRKHTGHFEYSYTQQTAEYNAFISLAPYWFPLFLIPACIIALTLWHHDHQLLVAVIGIGFGIDAVLNLRDISRVQTDITGITGGYSIGLLYIAAMNLTIFTTLAAYISQGTFGLKYLTYSLWQFMIHIVAHYRG